MKLSFLSSHLNEDTVDEQVGGDAESGTQASGRGKRLWWRSEDSCAHACKLG